MKYAKDFRQIARDNLRGRWGMAVVAGVVASLLGATGSGININLDESTTYELEALLSHIRNGWPGIYQLLVTFITAAVALSLAVAVGLFTLGSIISLGYHKFHLDLYDPESTASLGTLFKFFPHWKNAVLTRLRKTLIVLLWTFLLIVPGIIAAYNYAMTDYILAENPSLKPKEAMARSKALMEGNRWRLFCLECSFIGWALLCILTLGIGALWLEPYTKAAEAAFYRDLAENQPAYGTEYL